MAENQKEFYLLLLLSGRNADAEEYGQKCDLEHSNQRKPILKKDNSMEILVVEPGRIPYKKGIASSLAEMQALVGGTIQAIYPFEEPIALICNDEAKLLGLPLNRALYDNNGRIYDVVAGTFFLCGAPLGSSSFASLNDGEIQRFKHRFRYPELFVRIGNNVVAIQLKESEKGETLCQSMKLMPR